MNDITNRVLTLSDYMLNTKYTIREIANKYNISKSTVHKDLSKRLKSIDYNKYLNVQKIIKEHLEVRHIRGGESTKKKYLFLDN